MFTFSRGLLLLVCLAAVPCSYANDESAMPTRDTQIQPPVAAKHPHALKKHGDTRVDNYYWLRDDERQKPEVLAYLEAENAYTDAMLKPVGRCATSSIRRWWPAFPSRTSRCPM